MKPNTLFILFLLWFIPDQLDGKNTMTTTTLEMESPAYGELINVGVRSAPFTYSDTRDTRIYNNAYEGRPTNDVTYVFTITAPMTVILSQRGSSVIGTYLSLISEWNDLMWAFSSIEKQSLEVELPAGTYYVVSEGYTENGYITTNIEGKTAPIQVTIGYINKAFTSSYTYDTNLATNSYEGRPTKDVTYCFTLGFPMHLVISHAGSTVNDTFMSLLDSSKRPITSNNDCYDEGACPNPLHSYLSVDLAPGTYYVVSEGYTEDGYIITNFEGKFIPTTTELGLKNLAFTYSHTQNTNACTNAYEGRPTNDVTYSFTLAHPMHLVISHAGSVVYDTYMSLLDSSKNLIVSNNDYYGTGACPNPLHSYLSIDLSPGTYYVVSEGYTENGNITTNIIGEFYPVTVNMGVKDDAFTYSHAQDTNLSANGYEGRSTKDVTYSFSLSVPMHLVVTHTGSAVNNTSVSLLDSSKNLIVFNNGYSGFGAYPGPRLSIDLVPGDYYIVSEGYTENGLITTNIRATCQSGTLAGSRNQNHILTITPTVSSSNAVNLTSDQCLQQIQYFDGLGRPFQTVQIKASPSGADFVSLQQYDDFGNKSLDWMPVVVSNNNGASISPWSFNDLAFSTYHDVAYSLFFYERSPLGRIAQQYGPGEQWQIDNRSVKTSYMVNLADNDTLNCICYTAIDVANDSALVINRVSNYPSSQLSVTRIEDEDGCIAFEFKDKIGQVVLTRQVIRNGTSKELYDTYYIYDELGLKRVVLPPSASDVFRGSNATSWNSKTDETLQKYAYLYKYDKRKRGIAKKLPGCSWNYYVYDYADRLIFSQDGEQRKRGEWTFTIPDILGRPCLMGTCKNIYNALSSVSPLSVVMRTERDNANAVYKGYANPSVTLASPKLLTVNYYDDYNFLNKTAIAEFNSSEFGFVQEAGYEDKCSSAKTLLTGTLVAQLDESSTTTYYGTVMYYDAIKQMIQCISSNHLSGKEKEHVAYNFTGTPDHRRHVHTASAKDKIMEDYVYTYDHAGRLEKKTHQLTVGNSVKPLTVLVENEYDMLGRLSESRVNGKTSMLCGYNYNIRSWTQRIWHNYFAEDLTYSHSGNIKTQEWKQAGKTRKYTFDYDGLSRLKSAAYTGDGNYSTSYAYDKQGNITRLLRYGNTGATTYGVIDSLTMSYSGNQLLRANDSGAIPTLSSSADFRKYGSAAPVEYTYDTNGSMKSDRNKGITNITYNLLNLPMSLFINNPFGQAVNKYVYTAGGKKLSVSKGSFKTDYVGNIIYENGVLKRILVDNGYYENGIYYFYIKDHLGNNRIVADQNGNLIQSTQYYPFGMAFADGLDPNKQPYKYNSKELDGDRGLNWSDYESRYMVFDIPHLTTMDPHAENYYSWSTYAYCGNNPVKYTDPTGMDWYIDTDNTYQYDPELNQSNQSKWLKKGQSYVGATYQVIDKNGDIIENYRSDGSIMYASEKGAYLRIWNNSQKTGNEEMAIIANNAILVLPSWQNDPTTSHVKKYSYLFENGKLIDPITNRKLSFSGTIHTHPELKTDMEGNVMHSWMGPSRDDYAYFGEHTPNIPFYVITADRRVHSYIPRNENTVTPLDLNRKSKMVEGITYGNYSLKNRGR